MLLFFLIKQELKIYTLVGMSAVLTSLKTCFSSSPAICFCLDLVYEVSSILAFL